MPNTPTYNLPYPTLSDTADVPRDIQALAGAVDSAIGSAAAGAGGTQKIADVTLASDTANIDLPSLPQTYAHLLVVHSLRGTSSSDIQPISLNVNNDGTGSYYSQLLRGNNNVASVIPFLAGAGMTIGGAPCATAASGVDTFGAGVLFIPNYTGSMYKQMVALSGAVTGGAAATMWIDAVVGLWFKTPAITRLTLSVLGGGVRTRSRATVYGLK